MELQQYQNLYQYLQSQQLPPSLTTQQKRKFINFSKNFIIKNNFIYKIDKRQQNNLLRVIRNYEAEPVLFMMHNDPTAGHFATDIMFEKIRSRYYWPQMYENIRAYVQACDQCQRRGKYKRTEPLHPIPAFEPFYQIGIDIVGPLPRSKKGNRYIVVAIDYLTKWPEAKALSEATAENVATFIYENIICQHGCPSRILSDRGSHFNNKMIDSLTQRFQIKHHFSTPYHPQTNGLVERFNRTLCEALAKTATDTDEWDLFIAPILFAYRTSKNSSTKIEPFFLVYGRSAKLPIDNDDNLCNNSDTLLKRVKHLIDDVPQIREEARVQINKSQQKQKDRHDAKLKKNISYQIGDKVLYFNAAKEKQWSGKLDPKWKGPFYIHQVLLNGSYKLRTLEGRVLITPVNGTLLKLYHDRQNWQPMVVINNIKRLDVQ
ncbi:DDE-type integrase/transposase/recombinase [Rhizophagus irregularis DAOM 181602=DAOM 197198]|nr:DDE-type integrase/transposase/recombinase [Rhizophagus irregularis DAOM 181602=DAOM 197198]